MPGTQIFTYVNIGKETTRGTPVAPTRQIYAEGTGVLDVDPGLDFHAAENAGVRTRIRRVTQTKEDVAASISVPAVSYDDLVWPISQLKGGLTGVGAGADKTWTWQPSMTAANSPEAYSIDVGDDTQNYRLQYGMMTSWKLSSAVEGITSLESSLFAQRAIKGAKASPAINSSVKIPGDLWSVKFAATQAALTGASISTNFLLDYDLEVQTGLAWRHYMDGNLYGAQHVETDIAATLSMTVESTALAVSEFYDKWLAQTLDFVRLKAIGSIIPTTAVPYSCQIDLPVLWSKVEPISGEQDGINLYKVTGNLAYDPTSAFSIQGVLVNTLATLP